MENNDGLLAAYIFDKKGGGQKISWDRVNTWQAKDGLLWIHLDYSKQSAMEWLSKSSGLDPFTIDSMTVEESRPRLVTNHTGLLIVLRGVNLNPGQDPEDMTSIRVWIDENRIITTRKRRSLAIDNIIRKIDSGNAPKTSGHFLSMLNKLLVDNMKSVHALIDEQVDELEESVISGESHTLRPMLADIRRQSISIKRYLSPQREALNQLYFEKTPLLSDLDKKHIREANDRVSRYIEGLDSARERAAITQEELSARLSEQMEGRMYLLSVVTVIFLPLTFFTGLLGINVAGIPWADKPSAFIAVCVFLAIVSGFQLFLMHQKKWI